MAMREVRYRVAWRYPCVEAAGGRRRGAAPSDGDARRRHPARHHSRGPAACAMGLGSVSPCEG